MSTVPPPATSESTGAGRVLVLSTVAFTLLFAVWLQFGMLGKAIAKDLALTQGQMYWAGFTAVMAGSLLRLPAGILTDRLGGRVVMTATLVLTAIPCWLLTQVHSYAGLLACAMGFGIAGNSFTVGIAWNSAWFSKERQGTALGTFGGGNVGASLTKFLGPAMLASIPAAGLLGGLIPGGWRGIPAVYTALLALMTIALWWGVPRPERTPGAGRTMVDMLAPLKNLRVWRFGLYYVVVFGAYVSLSLWLPTYYIDVFGTTPAVAGLLTALFIFPASLLRPFGGWLSDRFGARPVTYAAFIAIALLCIPLTLGGGALGITVFTALVASIGVCMGVGKASVYRYIPDYFPKDVGAVGGLVGTLGALGGAFLMPLFGMVESSFGLRQSAFVLLFALALVSIAWLHLVVTSIKRKEASGAYDAVPA